MDVDAARARIRFHSRLWFDAMAAYSALIAAHPDSAEYHRMRAELYDQVPAAEKMAEQDLAFAA
ncbi:MAG TPA: hypothetical protein VGD59_05895 [Acidisarcina sp.]